MFKSNNKTEILLVGAGGHARSCIDVIENSGTYKIAGLIGVREELYREFMGYRVIATDSDLSDLARQYQYAMISVGQIGSSFLRQRLYNHLIALGFTLPTIVSKLAHVSTHASLGSGSIIMHNAIINASACVGNNCIINNKALIEHNASIADHCHISTGAIINGDSKIGIGSFIGSGSIIKQGIKLGPNCVVGMGVSVRHNYPENSQITNGKKP